MLRNAAMIAGILACAGLFSACEKEEKAPVVIEMPELSIDEAALADLPEDHRALVGTTWLVGDFVGRFLGPDTVFIAGKPLAEMAPSGMEATYIYKDGIIEVSAADQVKSGTWDGESLVIDGVVGLRQ